MPVVRPGSYPAGGGANKGGSMLRHIRKAFKRQGTRGMTLIEIMAVIAIIGLIMGIVAVGIVPRLRKAERKSAEIQIHNIEGALDQFRLDNGYYPGSDQGLKALVDKPTSGRVPRDYQEGGYLKGGKVPKDPWGNDYLYTSPGTQGNPYEIVSLGADGQEGGEGEDADIRSWEVNK